MKQKCTTDRRLSLHLGSWMAVLVMTVSLLLTGCGNSEPDSRIQTPSSSSDYKEQNHLEVLDESEGEAATEKQSVLDETNPAVVVDLSELPAYSGSPYVEVNGNVPYFADSELTEASFESYSELDSLGRCGVAYACVGQDIMPTEERDAIGLVRPSGWQTVKYNGIVDGNYLYNRCHLICFQLTGENANVKNLITGTRYLNVEGMPGNGKWEQCCV